LTDVGSAASPSNRYELDGETIVYAIISDGPHQYRVEEGQVFEVERKDLPEGVTSFEFDRVLFVGGLPDGPKIGAPIVEGAKVLASVEGEVKGDKLIIQKFRRRKNYAVKKGHRQKYLRLKIESIQV
jgi:large subunit ribosomal protein L21